MEDKLYKVEKDGKIIEYYYGEKRVRPKIEVILGKLHIHVTSKINISKCSKILLEHFDEYYEMIQTNDNYAVPFKIRGKHVKVKITEGYDRVESLIEGDVLTIKAPKYLHIGLVINKLLGQECAKMYNEIYNKIKKILEAQEVGFERTVFLYRSSLYGSFNFRRREISINLILAMYDVKYLQSVLLHEYAHSKIHNHSKEFHALLETMMPNHRAIAKELDEKGIPKAVLIIPVDEQTKEILLRGGKEFKDGVSVLLDY